MLGRIPNEGLNVFFVLGDNDPQRLHLKDAGVRAVQAASQIVKKELAFEDAPEVITKVQALLLVHRFPAGQGPPLIPLLCSLLCGLKLFSPQPFLPISFRDRQLKRFMLHTGNESTMLGATAITNNGIPYPQIEEPVKRRRANQDHPSHQRIIPPMGPKKSQTSQRENGQPQPVREILLLVQLAIAAYQARGQSLLLIGTEVP